MVMGYWSVAILFWQLSIDHIVSVIYKRWGLSKTRLRHPSLPFGSLPYPTHTIGRRVRTYVRWVSHVTTKRKEVDHIPWVWGSVPRALRARGSPAKSDTLFKVRLKSHTLSGSIYLCSLYMEVPAPDSAPTRLGVHNTISLSNKTQHCHSTTCNIVKHSLNNRFCTMLKGVLAT